MTSSVEVAVTHQIKIGREDAWVKVAVNMEYDPAFDKPTVMIDSAQALVNRKIIDVIEKTVETVNNYEKGK